MDEVECWKLVKLTASGKMVSSNVTGPARTQYYLGKWNKPHRALRAIDQDICVFVTLDAAKIYSRGYVTSNYELWQCIGRGVHPPKRFMSCSNLSMTRTPSNLEEVVSGILSPWNVYQIFPIGTRMVKELMFVERVE